jgi:type IV secretory pathway VirB10-like protein
MSQPLDGERSVSDVANGKKRWFTPARKAGAIAIGAAVAVGFIVWKDPGRKKEDPEPPPPPTGISQSVTYDPPKPQPMPAAYQPMPPPASVQPPPPPAADRLPLALPLTNPAPQAVPQPRKPRMLSYATEAGAGGEHPANGSGGGRAGGAADPAQGSGTHVTYKGAEIVGGKTGAALDRDLLLMPGIIRCILDTGVNSTFAGPLLLPPR